MDVQSGFSAGVIIPAMLLASAGAGLVSGIMTVKCKVSSFISTLAVGITLSGFTTGLSGGSVLPQHSHRYHQLWAAEIHRRWLLCVGDAVPAGNHVLRSGAYHLWAKPVCCRRF